MSVEDIVVFEGDDAGYQDGIHRQGGYVLTKVGRKPGYMLHDSECSHLAPFVNLDNKLTKKPRRWAPHRRDLEGVGNRRDGSPPARVSGLHVGVDVSSA